MASRTTLRALQHLNLRFMQACENQPDEGERAWLPATLEECLEALGILLVKAGAEPSGAFSFWRLARAN